MQCVSAQVSPSKSLSLLDVGLLWCLGFGINEGIVMELKNDEMDVMLERWRRRSWSWLQIDSHNRILFLLDTAVFVNNPSSEPSSVIL